jgi:hypothetical protein
VSDDADVAPGDSNTEGIGKTGRKARRGLTCTRFDVFGGKVGVIALAPRWTSCESLRCGSRARVETGEI